jgi:hypothetical protein
LQFIAGDVLHEFFSPVDFMNSFTVFAPGGRLRGWYANVTHPSWIVVETEPMTLFWHDLYIDVVALPDGAVIVRDEDELAASDLSTTDPSLYKTILTARDEIVRRCNAREFPFHETGVYSASGSDRATSETTRGDGR